MNHRSAFSSIDVNRNYLGKEYQYKNWNKAAVKSAMQLNADTALIYGNVGIWKTTDNFIKFTEFNQGFPKGVDNRKVEKLIKTKRGEIYAGTLFGLYQLTNGMWEYVTIPVEEERVVDLMEINNDFFVLTRSNILKQTIDGFEVINLLPADNYDGKISLFRTLWELHSGEAFGLIGKLFVDFIGIIFLILSISGLVYFIYPKWIKKIKKKGKDAKGKVRFLKFNLKWHNHFGNWLLIFLVLITLTGMFLRPPLLIAIATNRVDKLPFTHLDHPNPWYDQLRRVLYDDELERIVLATNDGIYYSDDFFETAPKAYESQPPVSVMGVNVLEKEGKGQYLIGSFSGIFYWMPERNLVFDYITKRPHVPVKRMGPPIAAHPIAGYLKTREGKEILFDYNLGAGNLTDDTGFTIMPAKVQSSPMSLWNLCLEIHTGRIYQYLFGKFYILFIPIAGLTILWILIAGYLLYRKQKRMRL
jgi:hypothetical protein